MKGQVLGFDGTTGAITGEDGARYAFTAADWKGAAPARPRDAVDFVPAGTAATEIYVTTGRTGPAGPLFGGEGAMRVRGVAAARPQVLAEGVLILSCLLANFLAGANRGEGVTLFGLGDTMGQLREAAAMMNGLGGHGGSPASFTLLAILGYALWMIPIGAGYLLYREWQGRRDRRGELVVGAVALLSPLYVPLAKAALSSLTGGMGFGIRLGAFLGFGTGAVLVALCGAGLLATATGRLTRTPGL